MTTLLLTPRRSALLQGHDNALDVLVRLQAPPAPPAARGRPPLNLAIVLDRSGSMSGQPLAEARRCAGFMIDGLGPADRASLVIYDDKVQVLVPSTPVSDKAPFHRALETVVSGGSTALHAGWLAGAEQVSRHLAPGRISRVLLLSDGQANHGLTDAAQIAAQCSALAETGVSTSTYGLSTHFNEDLMGAMARAGGGNGYYGQTAADLMDPFREEFDLLSALCARRVRLTLAAAPGVGLTVLGSLLREGAGGPNDAWRLPDLAYGGEAWALARLHVPGSLTAASPALLLTASVAMESLEGARLAAGPAALSLPSLPAAAFGAVAEDPLVVRRAQEVEAADLQEQARDAARTGDWERVDTLLRAARAQAADNEWVQAALGVLEGYARQRRAQEFGKEAYYSTNKMRNRLTSAREGSLEEDKQAATFLQRKMEQGKSRDKPR